MSTQSLERTLPHNVDAEKSVLGAILVNNENYYRVLESLRSEDFYLCKRIASSSKGWWI
jgi:replicative DNA helicase